jgi:hypothetical protein
MREVYDFLKKCRAYYLATGEGDQPGAAACGYGSHGVRQFGHGRRADYRYLG